MFDCQLYPSELPETSRTFPTHSKCVDIIVKLSGKYGNSSARVIGSDLTKEYVEINADYRS
jgi:N-acetylglutamate synthase/N-acetylornithine aminotransferase